MALRSKMRAVLGFTMREHRAWIVNKNFEKEYQEYLHSAGATQSKKNDPFISLNFEPDKGHYEDQVHLDFYSENKRTMFLLKYSDIINAVEANTQ
jgi:hypothetical protein